MKRAELRKKILEQYRTLGDFCEEKGIRINTLSLTLCGKSNPTHRDIIRYCRWLGIKQEEVGEYFFPELGK